MRDVHAAAGEAVEAFGVVWLDLDVNLPYRGLRSPVAARRAQLEGMPAIPFVEVVGARSGRGLLRVNQPVRRQRQQREQFAVGRRQLQTQRLAVDSLHACERVARVASAEG